MIGGGGGHSASSFSSVKLCVMINFSLRHNVLCFSFVVVLYSIYSLYAIIKVVLLNESRHNGLCFSFVVVLYSMYSLYAIIKVVLLNERDCHV